MDTTHDCTAELHAKGYRATSARLSIIGILERAKRPLSAVEVSRKLPDVNEVTVYRTLEGFAARGLVRAGERDRVMRYSYADRAASSPSDLRGLRL